MEKMGDFFSDSEKRLLGEIKEIAEKQIEKEEVRQ